MTYGPDRTTLTLPLTYAGAESADFSSDFLTGRKNRTQKSDEKGTGATERRKADILAHLKDGKPAGRAATASAVGLQASRAIELLAEMAGEGSVMAEGVGRGRKYRLAGR